MDKDLDVEQEVEEVKRALAHWRMLRCWVKKDRVDWHSLTSPKLEGVDKPD